MKKLRVLTFIFCCAVTLVACSGGEESSSNVLRVAKDVELASMDQRMTLFMLGADLLILPQLLNMRSSWMWQQLKMRQRLMQVKNH